MPTPSSIPPALPSTLDGIAELSHHGVIRVRGADAASFLHGQLTSEVTTLPSDEARLAAFCTAKGRMLASFVVLKPAADEVWLVCGADVLPATIKRLRMFVLRAKAVLDEGDGALQVLGLSGSALTAACGGSLPSVWRRVPLAEGHLVRLPDAVDGDARWPRGLWVGPTARAAGLREGQPALTTAAWDWLEVASGVAPVKAATAEAFVPQMLNYELLGGVNFQKGCYPGQEIVARSQYRGTLKRRTQHVHGTAAMQPGAEVFWSGDAAQPSGLVASAAPHPVDGWDALVELKLAALDGGSLHLGSAEGPRLQLRPLPYALPAGDEGKAA